MSNLKSFPYNKCTFYSLHFYIRLLLTYSNPLRINISIPNMYNNHRFLNDEKILPFFISDRKPYRGNSYIPLQILSFFNPRCQILILSFLIYYKNLTNLYFLLNLYKYSHINNFSYFRLKSSLKLPSSIIYIFFWIDLFRLLIFQRNSLCIRVYYKKWFEACNFLLIFLHEKWFLTQPVLK